MTPDEATLMLKRAEAYPFSVSSHPAVFVDGRMLACSRPAPEWQDSTIEVGGSAVSLQSYCAQMGAGYARELNEPRIPVLAHGSNASIEALTRKFGSSDGPVVVPILRGHLDDFDIVYSAHFSAYGSIPSTLQHAPGTTVAVPFLHFTEAQLAVLHATERNYFFGPLSRVRLSTADAGELDEVWSYISRHGVLEIDGTPVGLAAVNGRRRRFPLLSEAAMLARARDALAPADDLATFVAATVRDDRLRERRTQWLREHASAFACPHWESP
jgi:hypothetical protein